MQAQDATQTRPTGGVLSETPRSRPDPDIDRRPSTDGLSFSRTLEEDTSRSLDAVGTVCRTVTICLLAAGAAGVATLVGIVLF